MHRKLHKMQKNITGTPTQPKNTHTHIESDSKPCVKKRILARFFPHLYFIISKYYFILNLEMYCLAFGDKSATNEVILPLIEMI